jgi:hypothetical protein
MVFDREGLKRRLLNGDSLEVSIGGGSYECWMEPHGNPPVVYYEGRIFPADKLDLIIGSLLENLERGELRCRWLEPGGIQEKSCEQAYRARAAEVPEGSL